jgi:hypothetical protein
MRNGSAAIAEIDRYNAGIVLERNVFIIVMFSQCGDSKEGRRSTG